MFSRVLFVVFVLLLAAFTSAAPTGNRLLPIAEGAGIHILNKHDLRSINIDVTPDQVSPAAAEVQVIREDTHEYEWAPQPAVPKCVKLNSSFYV